MYQNDIIISMMNTSSNVAIIIPYHKSKLSVDAQYSIRHLQTYLSEFPIFFVLPEGVRTPVDDFEVKYFSQEHFTDESAYNKFLIKPDLYEAFLDFNYILIYQTDVIVFSNRLLEFCQMGYDYIGAPLIRDKVDPTTGDPAGFLGGGNGGFSLRKVSAFLQVLNTSVCATGLDRDCLQRIFSHHYDDLIDDPIPLRLAKIANIARKLRKGFSHYTENYRWHEDHFWGFRAPIFDPSFKVAPVPVALKFAFERNPSYCLEQNGRELPFGAHAWERYDRGFWEPYLIKSSEPK